MNAKDIFFETHTQGMGEGINFPEEKRRLFGIVG